MIFKNCIIYKLAAAIDLDSEAFADGFEGNPARDPGALELSASGFTTAYPGGPDVLSLRVNNGTRASLFTLEHRKRIIPPSAIRHEWEAEIKRRKDERGSALSRRECYRLKEEVLESMIPKAFIATSFTQAMMLGNYLLVDSSSAKAAECLISHVRGALGSFPVVPWTLTGSPRLFMNEARTGNLGLFRLSSQRNVALFKDASKAAVSTRDFDIQREETSELVRNGANIERMGLCWAGEVDFVLSDDLTLRRVRFAETFKEQAYDDAGEEAGREAVFEASALIFAGTMERLLHDLADAIGDDPSDNEDL